MPPPYFGRFFFCLNCEKFGLFAVLISSFICPCMPFLFLGVCFYCSCLNCSCVSFCGVLWYYLRLFIRNIGNSFLRVNNVKFSSPPAFFIFRVLYFQISVFKFQISIFKIQQNQKSNFQILSVSVIRYIVKFLCFVYMGKCRLYSPP